MGRGRSGVREHPCYNHYVMRVIEMESETHNVKRTGIKDLKLGSS